MHHKIFLFGIVFLYCFAASGQITAPKFGEGMLNIVGKDSSWSAKFSSRIQFLGASKWKYGAGRFGKAEQQFLIRRARLKLSGFAYSPKLGYKFQLGFSESDMAEISPFNGEVSNVILDAVLMWNFHKNFDLWVGQTKLPGNREQLFSSANLQLVDRSALNGLFGLDRDLGLHLQHHFYVFDKIIIREMIAVSKGEGRGVIDENLGGYQYTARVEVLPFGNFLQEGDYVGGDIFREQTPKLSIAAAYNLTVDAVRTHVNKGDYLENDLGFYETDIATYYIDALLKYRGFSLLGEFSYRDAADPIAKNSDGSTTGQKVFTGKGLNVQGGYIFKSNWGIAGRFTTIIPDSGFVSNAINNRYTVGGSKFVVGHKLKMQTDFTYATTDGKNDFLEWRMGINLTF